MNDRTHEQSPKGVADGPRRATPAAVQEHPTLQLQRLIGNEAVVQMMRTGAGPVIQRDGESLMTGVDVDKPSTYDTGGGHSYADHGAHTTEDQQRERLKSGTAPSGRSSKVPKGAGASKFASDEKHVEAMKAAWSALVAKNVGAKSGLKGMGGKIPLAGAGPVYFRGGDATKIASEVYVDIQGAGGTTFRLNTMFPIASP